MGRVEPHTGFRRVAWGASATAVAVGGFCLLGWAVGAFTLLSVAPELVPINPMVALCLVAAGLALAGQLVPDARTHRTGRILAAGVALVGVSVLADRGLGTHVFSDAWVFRGRVLADPLMRLMATSTAACLVLVGGAIWALDAQKGARWRASEALAVALGLVALYHLMAYAYFALALINPASSPMALWTALGLMALSLGCLCARPGEGWMREVASPYQGGRTLRRLLLAWLALPVALAVPNVVAHRFVGTAVMSEVELIAVALGLTIWMGATLNREDAARDHHAELIQSELTILERIAEDAEVHETLGAIARLVESEAQGTIASILLVDDQKRVHVGAGPGLPDWYNQAIEGQPIGPKAGSCGTAAYYGRTVVTPDIAHDALWEDYRDLALRAGLAASWSTPLFDGGGRVVGTLAEYYRTPQDPTPKDRRMAEIAKHLAEIAIARQRSDAALRQARDELERRVGERTQALRSRERLLTEAQSMAHMGSWEWDMRRNVVRWSDELFRIYGLEPQQFGATFEAFLAQIRPDDRERVREAVLSSARTHRPYGIVEHIIRPSGEERTLASSGRVEVDADGRAVRMWGICLDITERKRAEEEVLRLNATLERRIAERTAQLEATNRELEAFSYSVSHDLRAPLRSIDGFSQMLLEDYEARLDEPGKDYLRRVRAASQRMAQLIDDILKLSRLTRGELRWGPVDLGAIAREVVDEVRQAEPSRRVTVDIAPGLTACGDARLLRVALENLIGNAWKFTGRHPRAHISVGATTRGGKRVFFVRDDGAGFDMAQADRLFRPFSRLHTDAEFPGTGIGLATVQRIIHRHGGHIWGEGAVEHGATFYFTLEEDNRP